MVILPSLFSFRVCLRTCMHACVFLLDADITVHACSKPPDNIQNKRASIGIVESELMGQVITVLTF